MKLTVKNTDYEEFTQKLRFEEDRQLLLFNETPVLFTTATFFASLLENLEITVGWEKACELLYRYGREAGFRGLQGILREIKSLKGQTLLERYWRYATVRGWGLWEIVKFDEKSGEAIIRGYNKAFGLYFKSMKRRVAADAFFAGVVAGLIKEATGKDLYVRETKCIALGDPYCQFETEQKV